MWIRHFICENAPISYVRWKFQRWKRSNFMFFTCYMAWNFPKGVVGAWRGDDFRDNGRVVYMSFTTVTRVWFLLHAVIWLKLPWSHVRKVLFSLSLPSIAGFLWVLRFPVFCYSNTGLILIVIRDNARVLHMSHTTVTRVRFLLRAVIWLKVPWSHLRRVLSSSTLPSIASFLQVLRFPPVVIMDPWGVTIPGPLGRTA